jgi:hypothetical protein
MPESHQNIGEVCVFIAGRCNNISQEALNVKTLCVVVGWWFRPNSWAAVVWHIFWVHRLVGQGCVQLLQLHCILKIILKERIEVNVDAQPQPVICVDKMQVRAMYYVYILAHQAHLQTENRRVAAVI